MKEQIERIQKLSNAFGPSGHEDEVANIVSYELGDIPHQMDHMRNVIVKTKHQKPVVMLDSHLDEVGLIVQAIKENGTIQFLAIGGWSLESFVGNTFLIYTRKNTYVKGIVASIPPHFKSQKGNQPLQDISELILDVGTSSKQETLDLGVQIGCFGVPNVQCTYDEQRDLLFGKAFDCRIGVAAQIETLKQVQNLDLQVEVAGSFAVQEEVGERGVLCTASKIKPDVMICFEGCPADDTFTAPYLTQTTLGKGPMLRHFDVSMITNWRFQQFALEIAQKYHIPVQESVRRGGGTNAAMVNHTWGTPAIVIGIPVRYIHSSYGWCKYADYANAIQLAMKIIEELNAEQIALL